MTFSVSVSGYDGQLINGVRDSTGASQSYSAEIEAVNTCVRRFIADLKLQGLYVSTVLVNGNQIATPAP
jgi:hypothetical protein